MSGTGLWLMYIYTRKESDGCLCNFCAQNSTHTLIAWTAARQKQDQERSEKGDDICYTNISNFSMKYPLGPEPENTYISAECLIQNAPILIVCFCARHKNYTVFTGEKYISNFTTAFCSFCHYSWMIQSKHKRTSLHMKRISWIFSAFQLNINIFVCCCLQIFGWLSFLFHYPRLHTLELVCRKTFE